MMSQEFPIIVKIESQRCVGYTQHFGNFASIIESIGVDKAGQRWKFHQLSVSHYNADGFSMSSIVQQHDYIKV